MRVLVIEDHERLVGALKEALEEGRFAVDVAHDSAEGSSKAETSKYDAVLLDLDLPGEDQLTLLRRWRKNGLTTHVLALVARGGRKNGRPAPHAEADMAPPHKEVVARLRGLLRRTEEKPEEVIRVRDLELNLTSHMVRRGGRRIDLTPREFALLELLARNRGQLVTRATIWKHLYDEDDEMCDNRVNVYIRLLRKKIDDDFEVPLIQTRWGLGYFLRDEED